MIERHCCTTFGNNNVCNDQRREHHIVHQQHTSAAPTQQVYNVQQVQRDSPSCDHLPDAHALRHDFVPAPPTAAPSAFRLRRRCEDIPEAQGLVPGARHHGSPVGRRGHVQHP